MKNVGTVFLGWVAAVSFSACFHDRPPKPQDDRPPLPKAEPGQSAPSVFLREGVLGARGPVVKPPALRWTVDSDLCRDLESLRESIALYPVPALYRFDRIWHRRRTLRALDRKVREVEGEIARVLARQEAAEAAIPRLDPGRRLKVGLRWESETLRVCLDKMRRAVPGLNVILADTLEDRFGERRVSLELDSGDNVLHAVQKLAEAAGAGIRLDRRAVVIGHPDRLAWIGKVRRDALRPRLYAQPWEEVRLENTSLGDLFSEVTWKDDATEWGARDQVWFVLRGPEPPLPVDLELVNLSVAEVIEYAAEQTHCALWHEQPNATIFMAPDGPASVEEQLMADFRFR